MILGFNPPSSRPIERFWRRPNYPVRGLSGWVPLAAMLLLATGSLMLLPGPALWLATGDTWAFSFSAVGVAFLFLGWAKLGLDISEVRRELGAHPTQRKNLMWLAYGISWVALVFGLITLGGQISIPPPPPIAREILRGLFPYVPSVYGPVVLGQVAILLLGRDYLVHPRGRLIGLIGTLTLLGISFTALTLQLLGGLGPAALLLAGSTGFGYLIVAVAWLLYSPAGNAARGRRARIASPQDVGQAVPELAKWRTWGRRRYGWATLIPGILLSLGGYLLAQFQLCLTPEVCTQPFVATGLGVLGFGLFLIILGLVFIATS